MTPNANTHADKVIDIEIPLCLRNFIISFWAETEASENVVVGTFSAVQ